MEHTKGEYYVDEDSYIMECGNSEESVAFIEAEGHEKPLSRIFSSHPDLLEACIQALVVCEHVGGMPDTIARLEKAIAKVNKSLLEK